MSAIPSPEGIDKLIHERARLGIMSSLAAAGPMTFSELKGTLGMTDGNLSVHARVLEEAGYVRIEKRFVGRKPQTTLSLSEKGARAFKDYVAYLERIVSPHGKD
jgi:DNA-binding transcriptional ArsR family regulator